MKTTMKTILLSSTLLLLNFLAQAQYAPTYTSGYDPNYVAVNSANFSPYGSTGYNTTQKHLATLTNLSLKIHNNLMSYYGNSQNAPTNPLPTLNDLNNSPAYKYDRIIKSNGIIARKVMYAKNHISGQPDPYVRMVIVRPDDNVVRPCIMITNGANWMIDFTKPGGYYLWALISDLALRGYSVVYYETVSNDLRVIAKLIPTNYPCNYSVGKNLPNGQFTDEGRKNAYANFQYAVAAYNYIITDATKPANERIINANINDINSFGISMGSLTAFMLAYSRDGVNYTTDNYKKFYKGLIAELSTDPNNPTTGTCDAFEILSNGYTKLCLNNNPTSNPNLKSIILGNSFTLGDQNYFTTQNGILPKVVPTQFLWGNEDYIVNYYDVSLYNSYISPISYDSTRKLMKYFNIPNRLIVNCNGHHLFERNFTSLPNNGIGYLDMHVSDFSVVLGNTIQSTDPNYLGFTIYSNCTNPTDTRYDNQNKYTSYFTDQSAGSCFRLFGSQLLYSISGVVHSNNILANFIKDVRTHTNMTSQNNPVYVKTNSNFSASIGICALFLDKFLYRINSAVTDGSIITGESCSSSTTPYSRMSNPSLKESKMEQNAIKIYPNPSDDLLTIELQSENESEALIELYNTTGVKLKSIEQNVQIGSNKYQIDTKDLPAGIYLIRTSYADKLQTTTITIAH